jgi:hypothetical protein
MEDQGVPQDPETRLQVENSRLRTAQRLANLISVFCIELACLLDDDAQSCCPALHWGLVLTAAEIRLLYSVFVKHAAAQRKALLHSLTMSPD